MKLRLLPLSFIFILQGSLQLAVTAQDATSYFNGTDNAAYVNWLQQASYNKSTFLASTTEEGNGVALLWTTNDVNINVAVAARAKGWVGFGLAESGSMRGADIILFTAETNQLVDSYVLDQPGKPFPDDCQSWTLVDSTVDGGFIIFEATRRLDTGDSQDRVIINDSNALVPPTRVIAAWGETSEPSYHGSNTTRGAIRFFGNESSADELQAFARTMQEEAEGNFTVQANDFLIPAEETRYQHFCFSRDDLLAMNVPLDLNLHTIGIEPIVDPRTKKYVHHFVVYGSNQPWNSSLSCDEYPSIEAVYVWAPGDEPLNLPANVGSPLGASAFQSFSLEIHYNNPDLDENMLDSSGVRFYYTSKKREFDLGIFRTGDPDIQLGGTSVSKNGGLSQHIFNCGSNCSSNYVTESVTVMREHLHMHATGVSTANVQIRDGEVIRQGQVQYWDFYAQGFTAVVQPPFELQPGDSFRTVCDYNANNSTVWGLGSQDEMCIAFLYYTHGKSQSARLETYQLCAGWAWEPTCQAVRQTIL